MSWRPIIPDRKTDELPPLIFLCRWRYFPGTFCGVHVDRSQALCGQHQIEEREGRERRLALQEEKVQR